MNLSFDVVIWDRSVVWEVRMWGRGIFYLFQFACIVAGMGLHGDGVSKLGIHDEEGY